MVSYPIPSIPAVPPANPSVGHFIMGDKGSLFIWDGEDWEVIPAPEYNWAWLRLTVKDLERERSKRSKYVFR